MRNKQEKSRHFLYLNSGWSPEICTILPPFNITPPGLAERTAIHICHANQPTPSPHNNAAHTTIQETVYDRIGEHAGCVESVHQPCDFPWVTLMTPCVPHSSHNEHQPTQRLVASHCHCRTGCPPVHHGNSTYPATRVGAVRGRGTHGADSDAVDGTICEEDEGEG